MNTAIVIAYNMIRIAAGSGLFDRTALMVRNLIGTDMSGDEKKAALKAFISENGLEIGGMLLDAVIALTRLRYEQR